MFVSQPGPKALLNDLIGRHLGAARKIAVLEAGGGSKTQIALEALDVGHITTIDISPEQLARNAYADTRIEGDLETYRHDRSYDLVVIHQVLEHLAAADRALDNLAEAVRGGGLMVVGGPYPRSFAGLVTRVTPHWFHVFFYRFVLKHPDAGKPGHAPFPTHYHPLTDPARLTEFMAARGFDCVYLGFYEISTYRRAREKQPLVGALLMAATGLVNLLTPKRYDARHSDFCALFRRRQVEGRALDMAAE